MPRALALAQLCIPARARLFALARARAWTFRDALSDLVAPAGEVHSRNQRRLHIYIYIYARVCVCWSFPTSRPAGSLVSKALHLPPQFDSVVAAELARHSESPAHGKLLALLRVRRRCACGVVSGCGMWDVGCGGAFTTSRAFFFSYFPPLQLRQAADASGGASGALGPRAGAAADALLSASAAMVSAGARAGAPSASTSALCNTLGSLAKLSAVLAQDAEAESRADNEVRWARG